MGLLHWCTVQPQGSDPLAAVRFSAPVRISSIRIFPAGAHPFANAPDIVAETEPEAFYIDVFFNAHPIPQADAKEKPRVPNALVPTLIAYAGRQVEYIVDMGNEYATRLMILMGKFTKLSIAIYGDVVSDTPPRVERCETRPLPSIEPISLSRAIDPSSSSDPTSLAKKLLALMPDAPPLPLVIRLMFCLKPSNDDWELPDFPYLHADLESLGDEELNVETINDLLSKPVRDEVTEQELSAFAAKVAESISNPTDSNGAYSIARLFSISASQHPGLARELLRHLDIDSLFTPQNLDEETLVCLTEAASNADIARRMNTETFLLILRQAQESHRTDALTRKAARRLADRIVDWQCFEDSLINTQGDFNRSWNMLQDIGTEESSMAIWLETMITHDDVLARLAEMPVQKSLPSHSPLFFRNKMNITSHDAFVALVRALIGVASVLAVWAWTDSVGNDACREQVSAVIHMWQGVDGYREIINHLLLLRQLARRLNWISSDNEVPRQSGILAEKIICELAQDPQAVLNRDLVDTILQLKPKLTFITENELLSLRKIALVSEDGLPAAVEELMFSSDRPLSLRRLRTLRVSLAIVRRELDLPLGEWKTLESFWDEGSPGIVQCLVDLLVVISDDLNKQFVLFPPPPMDQTVAEQLFLTADELIRLITQLIPVYLLTTRAMRTLVVATADVFACTSAADMMFSQTSRAALSARNTRQACIDFLHTLSAAGVVAEPGKPGAEVVFKALLQHAGQCGQRDPVLHLLQVFTIIDHILPEPKATLYDEGEPSHWVTSVLPSVLDELKAFLRLLDPENKVHLVKRLIRLDDGVLGIGAWLLSEELKNMTRTIETLAARSRRESYKLLLQYQVTLSLQSILGLVGPETSSSKWALDVIASTNSLSAALNENLMALLDGRYTSKYLDKLIEILITSASSFEPDLQFTISLAALRIYNNAAQPHALLVTIAKIFTGLAAHVIYPEALRLELGPVLSALAVQHEMEAETAQSALSILQWLLTQEFGTRLTVLCGVSPDSFSALFSILHVSLPSENHDTIATLEATFTLDENDHLPPPPISLPENLELSVHDLDELMRQEIPTPTTPSTGTKTPDILGLIISPPTAILRSQVETTGLTKTYMNNDFRELRQTPSARQNTSRLPSMHVDDFQGTLMPAAPVPMVPGSELDMFPVGLPLLNMDI